MVQRPAGVLQVFILWAMMMLMRITILVHIMIDDEGNNVYDDNDNDKVSWGIWLGWHKLLQAGKRLARTNKIFEDHEVSQSVLSRSEAVLIPRSLVLNPQSSVLQYSVLGLHNSVLGPHFSILIPHFCRSAILDAQSAILSPRSSFLNLQSLVLREATLITTGLWGWPDVWC